MEGCKTAVKSVHFNQSIGEQPFFASRVRRRCTVTIEVYRNLLKQDRKAVPGARECSRRPRECSLRSEVNNSLITVNFFHKIQNFTQISDLLSQIWLKKRHTSLFSRIWREIRKKIHQNSQKKCNFRIFCDWISEFSLIQSQKNWRFLTKKLRLENGAKECIV